MSLRFIYGRAGCGKTHFCLEELTEKIDSGQSNPLFLLVPEQFTFQAERELIEMLRTGGILKNEVLSFRRLAFRVFNEVGGITYPHIHPAGKSMILYRILDKMGKTFTYFKNSADQPGFVSKMSELITELKHYNITPEQLNGIYNKLDENIPLKDKLNELKAIFEAFEKTLRERYRDSDDDLTVAAEKMKMSTQFRDSQIWIDGFTDFTTQEYKIIEELMIQSKQLTITLTTDKLDGQTSSIDVFSSSKGVYRKIMNMAIKNNIKFEPPVLLNPNPLHRFCKNEELFHLERNYDAHPYHVYNGKTQSISLFSSVNIYSEIEATAKDILRMCRDKGLRFRDIAVVTRDLGEYQKQIEAVFSDYQIPCFLDRKLDISNHPLVRLILSMLEIFTENWSYESVFRYLKSGLTGMEQNRIDRLENYVLACGIHGSGWTSENEWNMSPDFLPDADTLKYSAALLEDINRTRKEIVKPLMDFRYKTKGRRTAEEFCTALFDFLCLLQIPKRMETLVEKFRNNGELILANEYSQVWNMVIELMDQIVEVMADETFGVERFANIMRIGFAEYKIGLIPASLDQVLVGSVERSKSHAIKALYILGTNDGIFPSNGGEEGILTDDERDRLNTMGMELAKTTRDSAFDESFLIYRTLTTPSDYLRISWPIADQEGKTLRPSIIVSNMKKIFPLCKLSSNILPPESNEEVLEEVSSRSAAFRGLTAALRQKADGKEILPVWQDVAQWFLQHDEWRNALSRTKEAFYYRNIAKPIDKDKVTSLYGDPVVSSVSKFERYSACPFSFFVQYGLGAKERKIFNLSPPDVGTFLHAAIERFSMIVDDTHGLGNKVMEKAENQAKMTWRTFDRMWCEKKVSEIIDDMVGQMKGSSFSSSKRFITLAFRLKRVVTRAVWLIAEHIRRSSFSPVDYEAGFGDGEKYPPIVLELDTGQKVHLYGRIDRVDSMDTTDGRYLRIVDYKSGAKDFKLSNVYYGLQIQLITYLDAIWDNLHNVNEKPVLPGGMLYFRIDDPLIKAKGDMLEEDIEKAIMKQLRMKGLLLADVKLIKEMDHTIEGSSLIIPATLNKGDVLGKNSSVATIEQFKVLRRFVRRLLKHLSTEILKGSVSIRPTKRKEGTACQYCSYLPICQFDTAMKENTYRVLHDMDNDKTYKHMKK